MNTRLNHNPNWPELAQRANWSVANLAKECNVSQRTLERHFFKQMGKKPNEWLAAQRQEQALKLLREGASVKETAFKLGYGYAHNFSRDFKAHWGFCPTAKLDLTTRPPGGVAP